MIIECKYCKMDNCPTGIALKTTYENPNYEYAKEEKMCRDKCQLEWICTREIGHSGPHEAQSGSIRSKAIARWYTETNDNLRRIK